MNSNKVVLAFLFIFSHTYFSWGQTGGGGPPGGGSSTVGFSNSTPKKVLNDPNNPNSGWAASTIQTDVAWTNIAGTKSIKIQPLQLLARGTGGNPDTWAPIAGPGMPYEDVKAVVTPTGNAGNTFGTLPSGKTVMFRLQLFDSNGTQIGNDTLSSEIIVP